MALQEAGLGNVFHALGNHAQPKGPDHLNDIAHDDLSFFRIAAVRKEMEVHLDAVHRHFLQHVQRGVSAAEVVHFHLESQFPKLHGGADHKVAVFRKGGFRDLDPKLIRRQPVGADQARELFGNVPVLPDVASGKVHRYRPVFSLPVPPLQIPAHALPHKAVQLIDQVGFFQQRNEFGRRDPAEPGVIPAAQRFRPDDLACFKMDLRLIPHPDFPVDHGIRQVVADIRNLLSFLPLIRVIEFIPVLAVVPNFALRDPGAVQHAVHIDLLVILRGQHVNPGAKADGRFLSAVDKVIADGVADVPDILNDLLIAQRVKKNGKAVGRDVSDTFIVIQVFHGLRGPETQQFVSGFPPQAVVDEGEILNIVEGNQIRNVRMRPDQLFRPFPEAAHAQRAGQRIRVHNLFQLLFMPQPDAPLFLYGDQNHQHSYCSHEQQNPLVLIKIIAEVVLIELPRGIVQGDGLPPGLRQLGNAPVQPLNDGPPFFGVERADPEIHGEHGGRLDGQVLIGRLLQHIAPHIGVVQQRVHTAFPQGFHAFRHGLVHVDFDAGVQLANGLRDAALGPEHSDLQPVEFRKFAGTFGHQREGGLEKVVRNDGRIAGRAEDGAAERHHHVVFRIVQCFLQGGLRDLNEGNVVSGVPGGGPHQVGADPDDFLRLIIPIENRAPVGRHADGQCFGSGCANRGERQAKRHEEQTEQLLQLSFSGRHVFQWRLSFRSTGDVSRWFNLLLVTVLR